MPEKLINEVVTAKTAGFCFGVKRAVDKVYEQIKTGDKIYTYGPIIHNDQVTGDFASRGVSIIEDEMELSDKTEGTVIIRSHGVGRKVYESIKESGLKIVDATCPFVLKIHRIVEKESAAGKQIIIVGNDGHPEVLGIKGWCENDAIVIGSVVEAEAFEPENTSMEYCIVSQTTFNSRKFQDIVEILQKKVYSVSTVNTICSATQERQSEARDLAKVADVMIVIGDRNSSNSRKLYEICSQECENTHFIQTLDDLNLELTKSIPCVGITAGASTPNNIIEEVQNYVRKF